MTIIDAVVAELLAGHTIFVLVGLVLTAAVLRQVASEERRRVRFLSLLTVAHVVLAVSAGVMRAGDVDGSAVVHFGSITCAALAGTGMVVTWVFSIGAQRVRLPLPPIVHDLVGAAAYAVVLIVLAGKAGINIAGLVATSAVLTAVVGLALQDTLGNLVAGLTLQSDSTVRLGEWIQIGDVQGKVVQMRWRFTALESRDGETLIVPNAVLIKDKLRILGRRQGLPTAWRRTLTFSVDYRAPHAVVIDAVQSALRSGPLPAGVSADPAPDCVVYGFAPGSVDYAVRYWLTQLSADISTDSEVRRRITAALLRAKLEHAYPLERRLVLQDHALTASTLAEELAQRRAVIGRIGILSVLTPEERDTLVSAVVEVPFERGEILFRVGTPSDSAFVIDRGEVSIRIAHGSGEAEHELATLTAGDVLGEMGVMTGEPRSATAVALTPVHAYRIDRGSFETLVRGRPELADALGRILAERQAEQVTARDRLGTSGDPSRRKTDVADMVARVRSFFGLEAQKR